MKTRTNIVKAESGKRKTGLGQRAYKGGNWDARWGHRAYKGGNVGSAR
jgi:hypothetical protein